MRTWRERWRREREGGQQIAAASACDSRRRALSAFFLMVIATICLAYSLINLFYLDKVALGLFELGVLAATSAALVDLKRNDNVERAAWVTVLASASLALFFFWYVRGEEAAAVWVVFFALINFFLLATRQAIAVYLVFTSVIVVMLMTYRGAWPAAQSDAAFINLVGALIAFGIAACYQERSREQAQAKVQTLADRDFLTSIWNRRHFIERIEAFRQANQSPGRQYSFILADIDRFKRINDTYGHAVGDEVLKAVAQRMAASVRSGDMVGRLGGEEFGVLLLDCDVADARYRAELIRAAVAGEPVATASQHVPVTISLGVAGGSTASEDFNELFTTADERLYMAKSQGRNRVVAEAGSAPASA